MGKWNRRYQPRYSNNRRNKYRDYDWSPPRETYRDPEFGVWQDNVPMWEKKFCFMSGVPWEKVLGAKNFMHCQSNILEWDDTAGKESFDNAKECYWSKLNGGQCEIHLPGPDAYIEDIDWNPYIDPELIEDLEQTFFVPNDKESRGEDIIQETKMNSFGSLKDPDGRLDNSDDPWGCDNAQSSGALKDKAAGFNQWDDPLDAQEEPTSNANPWECHDRRDSAFISNDVNDNPWERGHALTSQASKDKSMGWNQRDGSADAGDKPTNHGNSWECRDRWDSVNTKYDDNNSWQRGPAQTSQLSKNKATFWHTFWHQCHDRVNVIEKRSNSGNPWGYQERPSTAKYGSQGYHDRPGTANYGSQGYHDRPGTATAKYGSQGGTWSKTCDWKPQTYLDKGKTSDDDGSKWKNGKGWQDSGESSWGRNQREAGISRSNYHNGSNYSANVNHEGASKDAKNDWGQKQFGQYGGRPRSGFVEEREDMAGVCRKREGPGQNVPPDHKGPRLQYVDQTSRRWNNVSSNKRVNF